MVNSAATQPNNVREFDWLAPQPAQDSQFLEQFGFFPGLAELLMLRQVHALEHATVWVLSETLPMGETASQPDNETFGGLSTNRGFYLYGNVTRLNLQRAVRRALQRLKTGEWNLALHPRCGTNLSVSALLTAGLALGFHWFLPRSPIEQLFGLAAAAAMAAQIAPDMGMSAQKYLTTAIPFNLELVDISASQDLWGNPAYFVRLAWQDTGKGMGS